MTLVIDAPPSYEPERRWILDVVLRDWLGQEWELRPGDRAEVSITLAGDDPGRRVLLPDALFGTPEAGALTPAALPRAPVPWRPVSAAPAARRLPVLFGPRPAPPALLTREGDAVRVGVDVLGAAFFMLTRLEEVLVDTRDRYDRFPAAASVAHREGFLGTPVVDAWVDLLWSALRRLWPRLERPRGAFRVALSHDVDDPLAALGRAPPARVRQLAADLLRRRAPGLAARRVRSWATGRGDPHDTFDLLMAVSERHGVRSAFNFLATEQAGPLDAPYAVDDPWIRALLARIHARGHEAGFHAGFATFRDARRTAAEFGRFRTAAEAAGVRQATWGGRQHYLRWESPGTWASWERAGLDYDSTVGFADRVGFRLGTCREFTPFHLGERRALRLRERPLHVMDRTLFEYMGLGRDAAAAAVLDLARACRRHEGTLTLLWHNSVLLTRADRRWYDELVGSVLAA